MSGKHVDLYLKLYKNIANCRYINICINGHIIMRFVIPVLFYEITNVECVTQIYLLVEYKVYSI